MVLGLEQRLLPLGNTFVDFATSDQPRKPSSQPVLLLTRRASYAGFTPFVLARPEVRQLAIEAVQLEAARRRNPCFKSNWLEAAVTSSAVATPTIPSAGVLLQRGRGRGSAGGGSRWPRETTTVMLRNLPGRISQPALMDEIEHLGLDGLYDFLYVPCCFETGAGKGYGFINFNTPELALRLRDCWDGQRPFDNMAHDASGLSITPAVIQGFEDNVAKWNAPRVKRIRNPNLRPFVLQDRCGSEAMTGSRGKIGAGQRYATN